MSRNSESFEDVYMDVVLPALVIVGSRSHHRRQDQLSGGGVAGCHHAPIC